LEPWAADLFAACDHVSRLGQLRLAVDF